MGFGLLNHAQILTIFTLRRVVEDVWTYFGNTKVKNFVYSNDEG